MMLREYHHWRAQTYNLLVPGAGKNIEPRLDAKCMTDQAISISNKIRRLLRPYETKGATSTRRDLDNIITWAGLLDLDFRRQKAEFRVTPRLEAYPDTKTRNHFNAEFMEALGTSTSKQIVELVVEPAIVRWGNPDGENYHECKVLVKANVYCARFRRDGWGEHASYRRPEHRAGSKLASPNQRAPKRVS